MQVDLNLVSAQLFALWHKLLEIVIINPKFVCEFLRIQSEEKMREHWGEHIYRSVVETTDFAIPSEENVGEQHQKIAQKRRVGPNGTLVAQKMDGLNVIVLGSRGIKQSQASSKIKGSQDPEKHSVAHEDMLKEAGGS